MAHHGGFWRWFALWLTLVALGCHGTGRVEESIVAYPPPIKVAGGAPPADIRAPAPPADAKALPINLATALQLAGAQPYEIALASERIKIAAAELERAEALWLPTVYLGGDYYRHDGQLQDVSGNIFGTGKGSGG